MKEKNYIKLNNNESHLSLGNLFRIIKENSNSKNSFLQSELFCSLFQVDTIADSTVNNYCLGIRSINSQYKKKYIDWQKQYERNSFVLKPIILSMIEVLENQSSLALSIEEINRNQKLQLVCSKLYTLAKNDKSVLPPLENLLLELYTRNQLYDFLCQVLFFIVLEKKQPVHEGNEIMDLIERNLEKTAISIEDLKEFINLQLSEGIWSLRGLLQLAEQKNPLACFELASLEFYGLICQTPRYIKAYEYYKIAEEKNHPLATWAIGFLYEQGYIGTQSKKDKLLAFHYFNKARKLDCSAGYNSLGLIFLHGSMPHIRKSEVMAIRFFQKAIQKKNVYAYNNLGKLYEQKENLEKAFSYYLCSANLGESWACNKVGEYYRQGIGMKQDLQKAFYFYTQASQSPKFMKCPWGNYNLAVSFYQSGCVEIGLEADTNKAIALLEEVSDSLDEASLALVYLFYEEYLKNKENLSLRNRLQYYVEKVEHSSSFSLEQKQEIEQKMKQIYQKQFKIKYKLPKPNNSNEEEITNPK